MTSSSAAWVFGGARLISSASRIVVKTGPRRNWNVCDASWKTSVPRMSAGIRSGRELDPLEVGVEQPGEALGQQRLPQAGDPFEQDVAARVERGQELVDHVVLAEEDPAQAGLEPARVFMKLCEFHRSVFRSWISSLTRSNGGDGRGRALLLLDVVLGASAAARRRRAGAPAEDRESWRSRRATASTTSGAARARS